MASSTAFGILLLLISVATLSFALYALLRGGRGQRGGIGPISERGIHVIAGIRMLLIGLASLAGGLYLLLG
ncbi:MAG: hypothetical protein AVDCRST_MAG05-2257 [uncultured Rubrobacteraceae bacterium]|uniref:HIG1 domain-containing protein n=1 Tax=uncultured Rubrobacteraceae bacterium TaxID=349277 RepID=A0A6J4SF89_9ACTN|nr:MAG: hypothetical protein AVDCRST_MAG05-2257 [uncultured Rubrobacteraceae bacterium]